MYRWRLLGIRKGIIGIFRNLFNFLFWIIKLQFNLILSFGLDSSFNSKLTVYGPLCHTDGFCPKYLFVFVFKDGHIILCYFTALWQPVFIFVFYVCLGISGVFTSIYPPSDYQERSSLSCSEVLTFFYLTFYSLLSIEGYIMTVYLPL